MKSLKTIVCVAVILAASVSAQAIMLEDFDSVAGFTAGKSAGMTAIAYGINTDLKTQGTASAFLQVRNEGGTAGQYAYLEFPVSADLTGATLSLDSQTNPNGYIYRFDVFVYDSASNYEGWTGNAPHFLAWGTDTFEIGTGSVSGSFDPSDASKMRIYAFTKALAMPSYKNERLCLDNLTYVPEPATMSLLGFGGVAALIRRRKK